MPTWLVWRVGGDGWSLVEWTVGPVRAVVIDVVDDELLELAAVPDDGAVEELGSQTAIQRPAKTICSPAKPMVLGAAHARGLAEAQFLDGGLTHLELLDPAGDGHGE